MFFFYGHVRYQQ